MIAGLWVATLLVAVGVSSWAVGLASRQVTDPLPPSAVVDASITTGSDDGSPTPTPTAASPSRPTEDGPAGTRQEDQAETRTVTAVGGRASFRFEGGRVTLVWATPAAGFDVEVEDEADEVEVRFRSATHESRIRARYDQGAPTAEVEERPEDD